MLLQELKALYESFGIYYLLDVYFNFSLLDFSGIALNFISSNLFLKFVELGLE